jgi:enoyl-CoA hydratase/carnithine racemase
MKELSPQSLRDALPSQAEQAPAASGPDDQLSGPLASIMTSPKPVIAAVNGAAAGMGAVISLWCDLRFMADEAMLTMSFSQVGTVAEAGSSWLLPRLVGPAAAMDLLLSSRRVHAPEALAMGLVTRTAPAAELVGLAQEYVQDLAQKCSPASMAAIKQQLHSEMHSGLAASARRSAVLLAAALDGGDIKEGWQSYLEKRPPRYARIGREA